MTNDYGLTVELGFGRVLVCDGAVSGRNAIVLLQGGSGVVGERDPRGKRLAEIGETLASITFESIESLEVLQRALDRVREAMIAGVVPEAPDDEVQS